MGVRKNIYFTNAEVIAHLQKQINMSYYIEQLILADMRRTVIDEEKVREIVKDYMANAKKEE